MKIFFLSVHAPATCDAQRRFLRLLLGVQVFKIALKLDLVQVYAPSNDSEYREYTEWFLSINTASGGDR